ncbi:TIMD4 protein, partial [Heliornis fulica]|nr:TIMD4 protein [Heliornis fulica]
SEAVIRGVIGKPVQLPCFYQVAQHKGISDVCWGRGPCPNSKCNNKVLHTTGNRVTFRKSQRYNLQGYISYGDVTLTIGKVKAEDAGTYCCRIEVPGWFNDIKQNMRLEVVRAPPVMITTTRKAPVSPKRFRKTTFSPPKTSDHQTTAETTALTNTISEATTATTNHQATAETAVLTTTIPPATKTSVLPDFTTGFQAPDMRTEDDDMFCSTESVPLPGVTTEFTSTIPTTEGTRSADTSLMVEDASTAATTLPASTTLWTPKSALAPSVTMFSKPFQFFSSLFQFPSYAILIVCLTVVPILFILMLLLIWKRKHTKKFIIKSLGPAEDLEKVFSGAEGENSIFSL